MIFTKCKIISVAQEYLHTNDHYINKHNHAFTFDLGLHCGLIQKMLPRGIYLITGHTD